MNFPRNPTTDPRGAHGRRRGPQLVLLLCLGLVLFPPLHLSLASGDLFSAMAFTFGVPLIIVLAIFGLPLMDRPTSSGEAP